MRLCERLSVTSLLSGSRFSIFSMQFCWRNLAGLRECTSVASLDISKNYVEPEPGVGEFLLELNWLLCFYFKGNPAIRGIKNYRKVGSGGEAISA